MNRVIIVFITLTMAYIASCKECKECRECEFDPNVNPSGSYLDSNNCSDYKEFCGKELKEREGKDIYECGL